MPLSTPSAHQWVATRLDAVAAGTVTMSQRRLSAVEQRGGGLAAVQAAATQRGVHLLLLDDEDGRPLVAASRRPFTVLC